MDFASSTAGSALSLVALSQALRARGYQFVPVTPASHRSVNARAKNVCARSVRDVFGWSRRFSEDVLSDDLFALAARAGVLRRLPDGPAIWRSEVRAAMLDGLVFLHSAFPTEAADAVFFGPDSYRFASAIAQYLGGGKGGVRRAIDIGCGAGPGGILIGRACPEAEIILADINPAALAMARVNAMAAGVACIRCRQSDLFAEIEGNFDLIVANPPYLVDPAARTYRHGGGALGAALSLRILEESIRRLNPSGSLLLYTGSAIMDGEDRFRAEAAARLKDARFNWQYREIDPDVFGEELAGGPYRDADRIAAVLLTVERDR